MPLRRLTFENPWIEGVDAAKRRAISWAVLAAGVATVAVAVLGGRALASSLAPSLQAAAPAAWATFAVVALFYACVYAPLWLAASVGGLVEGRSVWRAETRIWLAIPVGAALGAIGFATAIGMAGATGVVQTGASAGSTAAAIVLGMLLVAFQTGAEEIFFRGWIQPVLCARLGPWVGLILTAALFAALHMVGGARGGLTILNLLLGGLWFGLLALRTGGLWAPLGAHWAWNWAESGLLGLDPNPGVGPTGSILDLDLVGSALWSGGESGMNGSLATTIVLLVIVGSLTAVSPKRER